MAAASAFTLSRTLACGTGQTDKARKRTDWYPSLKLVSVRLRLALIPTLRFGEIPFFLVPSCFAQRRCVSVRWEQCNGPFFVSQQLGSSEGRIRRLTML